MVLPLILLLILSVMNSVAKECPPPESIAPCTCSFGQFHLIILMCNHFTTEEELRSILHSLDDPYTHYYEISISNGDFESLGADLFGQVTADTIIMEYNEKLQSVDINVFRGPMSEYARWISLSYNPLLQEVDLRVLEVLTNLGLSLQMEGNGARKVIPPSVPTRVFDLHLGRNSFGEIKKDMFVNLIGLESLYLNQCGIGQIEEGSFAHLVNLTVLKLNNNGIGPVLQPGTLLLSSKVNKLVLDDNYIETVMPGAISGFSPIAHISLWANNLNSFPEETYRPILEELALGGGRITLYDNFDLPCDDCSIVWLFLNPELMVALDRYNCDPYTQITDIDPAPLIEECT